MYLLLPTADAVGSIIPPLAGAYSIDRNVHRQGNRMKVSAFLIALLLHEQPNLLSC